MVVEYSFLETSMCEWRLVLKRFFEPDTLIYRRLQRQKRALATKLRGGTFSKEIDSLAGYLLLAIVLSAFITVVIVLVVLRPHWSPLKREVQPYTFDVPSYYWEEVELNSNYFSYQPFEHREFIREKISVAAPGVFADDFAQVIVKESIKIGLDPLFVAALIQVESNYDRQAVSVKGARGLMQLLPETARFITQERGWSWLGEEYLEDPIYNVRLGVAYFKYLLDAYKNNTEIALLAYNWGPGKVQPTWQPGDDVLAPESVRSYARKVLELQRRWKEEFKSFKGSSGLYHN